MFKKFSFSLLICFMAITACKNSSKQQANAENPKTDAGHAQNQSNLTLPEGFKVEKVAEKIGAARRVVIKDNGDMYVSLNSTHNGHPLVALRDTTGDGKADVIKYFGKLGPGTGLRLHNGYLYYGSNTAVIRYALKPDQLVPDTPGETVASLPVQHEHQARSLAFDDQGNMYVNIGAPSNSCQEKDRKKGSMGQKPCPLLKKHGGIWQFDADKLNQTQAHGGTRYATGLRNCVALDWNPKAKSLYAVMHGRDQLHQNFPKYYSAEESAELPAEEFLMLKKNANYGWPYTYWDQHQKAFAVAPEYGGNGKKLDKSGQYEKPIMAFPGHWAPNGLLFYTGKQFPEKYRNGAFIAFHGSWNRAPEPQKGYKVVFVPFDKNLPSGDFENFADGFAGTSGAIRSPGDAEHRPCGLAQGPDGSLYVTDDRGGTIFRIVYTGKK